MAAASFGGQFLHGTLTEMAAAYLFHVARNHPFVDGNKRTALMSMIVFLGLNGLRLRARADALYGLVEGVATGRLEKAEIAVFVRRHSSAG